MPRYLRSLTLASMGCTFFCHIGDTMHQESKLESETESEIEASKVHWSELRSTCNSAKKQKAENMKIFKTLHKTDPVLFESWNKKFPMGMKKIAEGGQAEIFENAYDEREVYKVFKHGSSLQDLQKQWPDGMFENRHEFRFICTVHSALLFEDGRFAFNLPKYWGDLRTLMDRRRHRNNNQRPPFAKAQVKQIMFDIATGMLNLHQHEILHRDLKASNVLIEFRGATDNALMLGDADNAYFMKCHVADFECSVGVVGTGFWRAPEIILALQNRNITTNTFTKMADVYSYAMTYYEVLTGCDPFEDRDWDDYSWVLDGHKPELPDHVGPLTRELLTQCWDLDPLKRPTFENICEQLDLALTLGKKYE
jgi:serine/threonine protein kinase